MSNKKDKNIINLSKLSAQEALKAALQTKPPKNSNKFNYQYINEKLGDAVYKLTHGEGNAKHRLSTVLPKLLPHPVESLPEDLQGDWKWIKEQLKKHGTSQPPFIGIHNSTASKIIKRIVKVQSAINDIIQYGEDN